MKLEYKLTEPDLVHFQLFTVAHSKSLVKRRAKGKIFLLLIYGILGIFIWQKSGPVAAGLYFLVCLPLYFLYQFMERRQFVKHFERYTKEQHKDLMQQTFNLNLEDQAVTFYDGQETHSHPYHTLEKISETSQLFILHLPNQPAIVIPKGSLQHVEPVSSLLQTEATTHGIPYDDKQKWSWK